MSDEHNGTKDDTKVDFDFETNAPATCRECGASFPASRLDPSDCEPLCPQCKYIDWDDNDEDSEID